jgi:hypothetical protein
MCSNVVCPNSRHSLQELEGNIRIKITSSLRVREIFSAGARPAMYPFIPSIKQAKLQGTNGLYEVPAEAGVICDKAAVTAGVLTPEIRGHCM